MFSMNNLTHLGVEIEMQYMALNTQQLNFGVIIECATHTLSSRPWPYVADVDC